MFLNDLEITELANLGMINPFFPKLVSIVDLDLNQLSEKRKVISYGLSSFGYDITLSSKEFKVFKHIPGKVINPKSFNPKHLENVELQSDLYGEYFIIPGNSYGLGVAVERLEIPDDITVFCIGKSTYARCGLIANLTPGEAGWKGHFTLEFSNSSNADCRIYANEGVAQLLFAKGNKPDVSYADRKGKYQNQPEMVVISKV
jgi:dCTP deaminase